MTNIESGVREAIQSVVEPHKPGVKIFSTSTLVNDLEMDSLQITQAAAALEEKFNISVDDEKLAECETVADVSAVVETAKQT